VRKGWPQDCESEQCGPAEAGHYTRPGPAKAGHSVESKVMSAAQNK
jgi:hypothetical protein